MRTVQEIYDEAIHLIDAQNENTGATDGGDAKEYLVRAPKLLTSLLNEAYPYSDTYSETVDDYDVTRQYVVGDKVNYGGGRYRCKRDCIGVAPTVTDDWYCIARPGRRPTHPPVTAMTDLVDMDDYICLTALPAGLAALFSLDEDRDRYNAYWGDYMNRLAQARATLPAYDGFEDIENPYSETGFGAGIEYGQFSRWPW